jgi:hypothetical protein
MSKADVKKLLQYLVCVAYGGSEPYSRKEINKIYEKYGYKNGLSEDTYYEVDEELHPE